MHTRREFRRLSHADMRMRNKGNIIRDTKVAKRAIILPECPHRAHNGLILLCRPSKRRLGRFLSAGNSIYFRGRN